MMKFSVKFDLSLTSGQIDNLIRIVRQLLAALLMGLPSLCALT